MFVMTLTRDSYLFPWLFDLRATPPKYTRLHNFKHFLEPLWSIAIWDASDGVMLRYKMEKNNICFRQFQEVDEEGSSGLT